MWSAWENDPVNQCREGGRSNRILRPVVVAAALSHPACTVEPDKFVVFRDGLEMWWWGGTDRVYPCQLVGLHYTASAASHLILLHCVGHSDIRDRSANRETARFNYIIFIRYRNIL